MDRPVFRFAPSPNGFLHLGHAYSALANRTAAERYDGRLLLRIEDIDPTRRRDAFEQAIYEDLEWIGFHWERPVRRQSAHLADYAAALAVLKERGLAYPAFMSRGAINAWVESHESAGRAHARDPDGAPLYPGLDRQLAQSECARRIAAGEPHAWRLDMARAMESAGGGISWHESGAGPQGETGRIAADPRAWGDIVLARADAPASYALAVVVDDALQGVTNVVRGQDLFHATSVQRLLQHILGLPEPGYFHHALVRDMDGKKLAKSTGSTALRTLRARGVKPDELLGLAGIDPPVWPATAAGLTPSSAAT